MRDPSHQKGIITLMFTVIILLLITLTTLYTARVVVTDDKVFSNVYRNQQAENAARAGFDYALGFLNTSLLNQEMVLTNNTITRATVLPSGNNLAGCSSASNTATLTAPTPFSSNTTVTYRCINANDTNTIQIQSVGRSDDSSATRTVSATVQRTPESYVSLASFGAPTINSFGVVYASANCLKAAISTASSSASMGSSGVVIVGSGSTVNAGGACAATTACTTSAACSANGSLILSDPNISSLTTAALFEERYAGGSLTSLSAIADYVLTCSAAVTYTAASDALDKGAVCTIVNQNGAPAAPTWSSSGGRVIYFSMTASGAPANRTITIQGVGQTYGSATAPFIVIVTSTAGAPTITFNDSPTFYGGFYTAGDFSMSTTGTTVNGVVFTSNGTGNAYLQTASIHNGTAIARGTTRVTGSGTQLNRVNDTDLGYVRSTSILGYALMPGSMKDF